MVVGHGWGTARSDSPRLPGPAQSLGGGKDLRMARPLPAVVSGFRSNRGQQLGRESRHWVDQTLLGRKGLLGGLAAAHGGGTDRQNRLGRVKGHHLDRGEHG